MASVVLTTLSLPVFYFVARQYELDKTAALGATLLLATCLWYLHFSRNGWYNVNVALYAILAILAATAAIRRGSLPLYAAAGAMAALGLYGHPSGRAITIALIAYLPIRVASARRESKAVADRIRHHAFDRFSAVSPPPQRSLGRLGTATTHASPRPTYSTSRIALSSGTRASPRFLPSSHGTTSGASFSWTRTHPTSASTPDTSREVTGSWTDSRAYCSG